MTTKMNRLSSEKSAYLKHAANQKIDWYPWSDEAFQRAKKEDKPLFLSSGAVWCHWCHVMAGECFFDEEIAGFLNENFINIKLDRDERPDIDRRYQMAVSAMGSGGGWPLSVFLAPDKKPFYGGTYFPPEDKLGRPGFKKVIKAVNGLYKSKRKEISEYSEKLINALKPSLSVPDEINASQSDDAVKNILSDFDPQNGGFGNEPKFPMPGAMELLINRYFLKLEESVGYAVRKTLESMASGGFHDQIGGGFHRYSTDKAWIIPHFEKMADDNAWLLRNYLNAYCVLGDNLFKDVAEGIISFTRNVLSDPEGGFYTSQDADVTPDDEGGYFTWTEEELRNALNDEEFRILSLHLVHEAGAMHHNESKKVLFVAMGAKEVAEKTGENISKVIEIIHKGKEKLLKKRNERTSPFIDKTFYTSINGMLISVYLQVFRILKDKSLKDFALKSLQKIMEKNFIDNELFHTEGIRALLDDYVYLIDSLIAAYETTGETSYIDKADELMNICINKLWDKDEGGFYDTDDDILEVKIKGIEDIPQPSANSVCIRLLLKLFSITGKEKYYMYAERTLKIFSSKAKDIGIHAGYYYCALDAYFNELKLTLHTKPSNELSDTAISLFHPYMSISYGEVRGCVVPCLKGFCYEPIKNTVTLKDFFKSRKYMRNAAT
jgi:uncharacterized protein YyaL (SSP411 family)